MTDIVITAASVLAGSGADAQFEEGVAGATITAGQAVYRDSSTRKYLLADSNSATVEARQARGIALHAALLNQPLRIQKSGDMTIGGTLTAGVAYYLSDTPGGICPVADVGSGEFVCQLGLSKSTAVLTLDIQFPGVSL